MRYIGDTHSCTNAYRRLAEGAPASIQLGDLGIGHSDITPPRPQDRFLRGNHDDPVLCRQHPNWIPDGHFENGTFFLGGAASIDKAEPGGMNWYRDEELSYGELMELLERYERLRPDVVCSHDCPASIGKTLFGHEGASRTASALEAMLQLHRPKLWIFGHHHRQVEHREGGTHFYGLGKLSCIDI